MKSSIINTVWYWYISNIKNNENIYKPERGTSTHECDIWWHLKSMGVKLNFPMNAIGTSEWPSERRLNQIHTLHNVSE